MSDSVNVSNTSANSPPPGAFEIPLSITAIRYTYIPIWIMLLFFGLFGNALTVFVLQAKRLKQSSTSFYLTALAITDMLYLLTSLVSSIANFTYFFPFELRQTSKTFCVLLPFLNYTLAYISIWLLVAVTVERAIWVVLPFRAHRICTRRTAKFIVPLLLIVFTILDIHFFITMRYVEISKDKWICRPNSFTDKIFPYLDLLLVAVLPCTVMLIANCLIGWKLRVMRKFRTGTLTGSKTLNSNADSSNTEKREKSTNLTRMLVSTNVFFIISVTPLLIYDVVFFSIDVKSWAEENEKVRGGILFGLERFVYTLWYTNFAIHFLLYCLSGPPFRAEVLVLFNRIRIRFCNAQKNPIREQNKVKLIVPEKTSAVAPTSAIKEVASRVELF
ncbi:hypothetical protein ACTXT7_014280 [Hymenolepis weldensis]